MGRFFLGGQETCFLGVVAQSLVGGGGSGVSRRFSAVVAVAVLGAKARRPGSQEAGTAEPQKRKKPIWMDRTDTKTKKTLN